MLLLLGAFEQASITAIGMLVPAFDSGSLQPAYSRMGLGQCRRRDPGPWLPYSSAGASLNNTWRHERPPAFRKLIVVL